MIEMFDGKLVQFISNFEFFFWKKPIKNNICDNRSQSDELYHHIYYLIFEKCYL